MPPCARPSESLCPSLVGAVRGLGRVAERLPVDGVQLGERLVRLVGWQESVAGVAGDVGDGVGAVGHEVEHERPTRA